MALRDQLVRLGLARPPAPIFRTYVPRPPGKPEPRELPFGPVACTDEWGTEFELWQANKLSLNVTANAVQVQLARTMPPNPPVWGGPITLQTGPYSHVGPFGYWRFRNRSAGLQGVVEGTAFSE